MRRRNGFGPLLLVALSLSGAARADAQTATQSTVRGRPAADTAALLQDLRTLAADSMEGRQTGSTGAERARRYLESRLATIGVEPAGAAGFRSPFRFAACRDSAGRGGVNLIARVSGRDAGRIIVVTAHYDHVGIRNGQVFNGADDNASGVAALLAVARSLAADPPRHTVVLAALDAEETGLRGAHAFVDSPPVSRDDIAINLNFDMVGRNAAGELWVAGTHHYPFLAPFVEELAGRSRITLKAGHDRPDLGPGQDWTGSSDHAAFHAARIPFLYFGVEDHADYHRPTDDAERIDAAFFTAAVETLVDAVRSLDRELERRVPVRSR